MSSAENDIASGEYVEYLRNTIKSALEEYGSVFEFNDESTTRTFKIQSGYKIYHRPNSNYPGHFVIWNDELKRGNWIDFAEYLMAYFSHCQ
jgi:hypothetical protein